MAGRGRGRHASCARKGGRSRGVWDADAAPPPSLQRTAAEATLGHSLFSWLFIVRTPSFARLKRTTLRTLYGPLPPLRGGARQRVPPPPRPNPLSQSDECGIERYNSLSLCTQWYRNLEAASESQCCRRGRIGKSRLPWQTQCCRRGSIGKLEAALEKSMLLESEDWKLEAALAHSLCAPCDSLCVP